MIPGMNHQMNQSLNLETDTRHVTALIPDYVLDLLAREEQRFVLSHLAVCRRCRLAVQRERQILFAVRDTLSLATQPDPKRLSSLRPATPQRGSKLMPLMHKPLAATLLLLLVILGSLALQVRRSETIWPVASPGVFAATASVTDTPTIAATSTATEMAPAAPAQPTPQPARTAVRAILAPRPAVAPVAVSSFLRGY